MRAFAVAAVIVLAAVIGPPLTGWLVLAGTRPDPVLLSLVVIGLVSGPDLGLRAGFAGGLLRDLVRGPGHLLGIGALVGLVVGSVAGRLRVLVQDQPLWAVAAVAGGLCAGATLAEGLLASLLGRGSTLPAILRATFAAGLLNGLLAPPVVVGVRAVFRRAEEMATPGARS